MVPWFLRWDLLVEICLSVRRTREQWPDYGAILSGKSTKSMLHTLGLWEITDETQVQPSLLVRNPAIGLLPWRCCGVSWHVRSIFGAWYDITHENLRERREPGIGIRPVRHKILYAHIHQFKKSEAKAVGVQFLNGLVCWGKFTGSPYI